jgi:hypothetical protein
LFHRWGNRHFLIRTLVRDPRWALVYHDEVAVVFVRAANNARVVATAREAFPSWYEKTQAMLSAPVASWQVPVERTTALQSYAALLFTIGEAEAGVREYERLLALDVPGDVEGLVRFRIGYYLASKGDLNAARLHLVRAAALRPDDRRVRELIERIDAVGG